MLVRTDNTNNESFHPDWKPDSSSIVYQDNGDLWTVTPTGLTTVQLTNDVLIEGVPSWSPDGKLIAYNQGAAGSFGAQISLIDPLTKVRRRVTPDPANEFDLFPAWQPVGNVTAPNYHVWGANTCGPQPAAKDVLRTLQYLAGVQTAATGCPPMGQHGLTSTNVEGHWGDLNCSGIIDAGDVLLQLQYLPEVGPFASENIDYNPACPPIGSYLQWISLS